MFISSFASSWPPLPPFGPEDPAVPPQSARPAFTPGTIPRGAPQLAARRLDGSLLARLYHATAMAETILFPLHVARSPIDRNRQNKRMASIIGLDTAVRFGVIEGYAICWPKGRYPKMAASIRLRVPGGHRRRAWELGELEGELRAFVQALKEVPHSQ